MPVPVGFIHLKPNFRFEPLTIIVNGANQANWCSTNAGRQYGQVVKGLLARGIEHAIKLERIQPLGFSGHGDSKKKQPPDCGLNYASVHPCFFLYAFSVVV